ncbi:MAG: Imm5 family immunity protein [Methyloligellaceae bacterium]
MSSAFYSSIAYLGKPCWEDLSTDGKQILLEYWNWYIDEVAQIAENFLSKLSLELKRT